MPKFKKGQSGNPKGRKKSTPNKTTTLIKQALLESFDAVGGVKYLKKLAVEEPKSYAMLLARIIPAELHAEVSGQVTTVVARDYTGVEWDERAQDRASIH